MTRLVLPDKLLDPRLVPQGLAHPVIEVESIHGLPRGTQGQPAVLVDRPPAAAQPGEELFDAAKVSRGAEQLAHDGVVLMAHIERPKIGDLRKREVGCPEHPPTRLASPATRRP